MNSETLIQNQLYNYTYTSERDRLVAALGELTEGGIIEGIQQIGLHRSVTSRVEIGMCVWPYPLTSEDLNSIVALGYLPIQNETGEIADLQCFSQNGGKCSLTITAAGGEIWTDWNLVRSYTNQLLQEGIGTHTADDDRLIKEARNWHVEHNGFEPLLEATLELRDMPCPWYLSSGWSIDLFLNRVTRVHHDIDVVVARTDQLIAREYMAERGWRWVTPHDNTLKPWPAAMRLESPRHQAHCHKNGQMFDFLLSDIENGIWRYRKDPNIMRSMQSLVQKSLSGLPYLSPEATLVYKSKRNIDGNLRPKDNEDFLAIQSYLGAESRAWLAWALTATSPDHPWITALTTQNSVGSCAQQV